MNSVGFVAGSRRHPPTSFTSFGQVFPNSATVNLTGQTDVVIDSLTFRNSDFRNISLTSCTNVTITNCDFDQCGGGIYLLDCTGTLEIGWIRGYELQGVPGNDNAHLIQLNNSQMTGRIHDIRNLGGITGDVISLYKSGGVDDTNRLIIEDFALEGIDWTNTSGAGLILGDGGHAGYATARNFTMLSPAAVGAGIAGGTAYKIQGGVIYGAQRTGSNLGLYVWNQADDVSSGHEVSNNRTEWFKADGTHNNRFDGGNSGTITGWTSGTDTNQWGAPAGIDPSTLHVDLDAAWPSTGPATNTVALLGDSRVFRVSGDAQPTAGWMHHAGFCLWVRRFTGGAAQFNQALNFGVGGYTTTDVVNNTLASCAASSADSVIVMVGVNDWGQSIPQATSLANLDTIVNTLVGAGKFVFICDDSPATESSSAYTQHNAIRDHIRAMTGDNITVCNTWNQVAVSTDSNTPGSGMEDTVHYGPWAASKVGYEVASKMLPILPTFDLWGRSGVLSGGDFTGTGGTVSGGVTGTVPNGWTVALESGTGTVACSIVADGGYNWLVVTLTGGAAPKIGIYTGDLDTGWVAGTDRLDMAIKCKIDAGSANIIMCQLQSLGSNGSAMITDGGVRRAYDGAIVNSTTNPLSPSAHTENAFWLPHVKYTSGLTSFNQRIEIRGAASGTSSGVFRFALPQLRKYTGSLTD